MIKDLSKIVNHCQRNWEYTPIPNEHIDAIVDAGRNMPTKQSTKSYTIVKITNPKVISSMYEQSYESKDKNHGSNTQVDAPLLLAFLMNKKVIRKEPITPIKLKFGENLTERAKNGNLQITNMEIGLSAGACALQAAELGYKTGFCKCISDPDMLVKKILGQSPKDYRIMLLLGIGNPIPDLAHNVKKTRTKTYSHVHEGKLSNTYTKKIPVISIT
jgi:nitroreductase|tara:strand:+ start:164 stop:811 length:648 start_codon:yes stop_codon:yes gene_type:complete